ncbi:MAG: suppressor of fused domain protein [Cytophagales bacterium]|nr:MAG: suppressor of fused domain protein [Cytophagales bacterium]TAF60259.1 MAG: suppressor of fused domain protein [Cytophagales bacterium]
MKGSPKSKKSAAEYYLEHLDDVFGQEPEFFKDEGAEDGLPEVMMIVYRDLPEPGYITALTYGLSLAHHPEWEKTTRNELCICLESTDLDWAMVLGYVATGLRGRAPFFYGETINIGEPISEDTKMDALMVFAPSVLEEEDYTAIEVGQDYKINIVGLYPLYASEIEVLQKLGLKDFWHHENFDMYSVNRKKVELEGKK